MPQLLKHNAQQSRPRTDYERWLGDRNPDFQAANSPGYHSPITVIGESSVSSPGSQANLRQLGSPTHSDGVHYRGEHKHHGYFMVEPGTQPVPGLGRPSSAAL
ncbi:hypothetical protein ETB97_008346 [Aspergillus alliaceus]|uniref:Uncharacterized protein n=1 Tax=Petromyces alliaceus TaxID=209559 RepID=A0A5N6G173_PETAA|nr:uncharacterized protein BDW43DRAFT_309631 [Aspergillus alliaceus]KAB8235265.1 hypothetical protein BDW43DRAFT_309631 [Aspergillus alliaceus]KAF5855822.1 hypothetical protein ETB97_008346 [Aspergillus burnettii]